MEYSENIAAAMLADPRYVGAISPKMVAVWRSRGKMPDKYFNPKYVRAIKDGRPDLANQVKDPYFNESFILKIPLTDAEKATQARLIEVLRSEKILTLSVLTPGGVGKQEFVDSMRTDPAKQVDMRSESILAIKKNLQDLRIKIKKVVEALQDKTRFTERDVRMLDELLTDKRLVVAPLIAFRLYSDRHHARRTGRQTYFENPEISHVLNQLAVFLLETAL